MADGGVSLANPGLTRAVALDPVGSSRAPAVVAREEGVHWW